MGSSGKMKARPDSIATYAVEFVDSHVKVGGLVCPLTPHGRYLAMSNNSYDHREYIMAPAGEDR